MTETAILAEEIDFEVSDMIKVISESKSHGKRISFECRCEFDGRKFNSKKK